MAHASCSINVGSRMIKNSFALGWILGEGAAICLGGCLGVQKFHRSKWNDSAWKSFMKHKEYVG